MKIVHFIFSLRRGGAERVTVELCGALKKKGHGAIICTIVPKNDYKAETQAAAIPVFPLTSNLDFKFPLDWLKTAILLRRFIAIHKPDVLHVHTTVAEFITWIARISNPTIVTLHSKRSWWKKATGIREKIWSFAFKRAYKKKNWRLIAVSNYVRESLNGFRCVTNPIYIIHNGINSEKFVRDSARNKIEFRIVVLGSLYWIKRPIAALAAFRMLVKEIPSAKLIYAGDGEDKSELQRCISAWELGDSVQLLGQVQDVKALLSESDVLWQLSISEGFPMSVLEAMACEVPVIASNVGGIPELVKDEETGFLVGGGNVENILDATINLAKDSSLALKFGTAARKRVNDYFDQKIIVEKYIEVYLQCINTFR